MNERKMARVQYVLSEANRTCQTVRANQITKDTNFKLIHVYGKCNTEKPVTDEKFGLAID